MTDNVEILDGYMTERRKREGEGEGERERGRES